MRIQPAQKLDIAQRYSIEEAIGFLRTSRARFYEKVSNGEITTIKDGRRTYVPGTEIARLSGVPGGAR